MLLLLDERITHYITSNLLVSCHCKVHRCKVHVCIFMCQVSVDSVLKVLRSSSILRISSVDGYVLILWFLS